VVVALGDYMNAECQACIGGTAVREDLHRLSNGVHIVVGTPGRVYDMISRRALSTFSSAFIIPSVLEVLRIVESISR